jgi:hypothetical protein
MSARLAYAPRMGSSILPGEDGLERAVLSLLLADEDAGWQSIEQLVHEIGDRTATLRALDRLRAIGLAESDRDLARPSAAAKRFDELGI